MTNININPAKPLSQSAQATLNKLKCCLINNRHLILKTAFPNQIFSDVDFITDIFILLNKKLLSNLMEKFNMFINCAISYHALTYEINYEIEEFNQHKKKYIDRFYVALLNSNHTEEALDAFLAKDCHIHLSLADLIPDLNMLNAFFSTFCRLLSANNELLIHLSLPAARAYSTQKNIERVKTYLEKKKDTALFFHDPTETNNAFSDTSTPISQY